MLRQELGLHEMNNIKNLDDYDDYVTCDGYKNAPFRLLIFFLISVQTISHIYSILQLLDMTILCLLLPHSLVFVFKAIEIS